MADKGGDRIMELKNRSQYLDKLISVQDMEVIKVVTGIRRCGKSSLLILPNHQLQTVARYCGYDLTNHHHALADAEACAVIALHLL